MRVDKFLQICGQGLINWCSVLATQTFGLFTQLQRKGCRWFKTKVQNFVFFFLIKVVYYCTSAPAQCVLHEQQLDSGSSAIFQKYSLEKGSVKIFVNTVEIVCQGKTKSFAQNLPVTIKSTEAVSFYSFKEILSILHQKH